MLTSGGQGGSKLDVEDFSPCSFGTDKPCWLGFDGEGGFGKTAGEGTDVSFFCYAGHLLKKLVCDCLAVIHADDLAKCLH